MHPITSPRNELGGGKGRGGGIEKQKSKTIGREKDEKKYEKRERDRDRESERLCVRECVCVGECVWSAPRAKTQHSTIEGTRVRRHNNLHNILVCLPGKVLDHILPKVSATEELVLVKGKHLVHHLKGKRRGVERNGIVG